MCSVNERIDKLKKETADLRKEVKDLKETILQQNELIINLISKQSGMLEETIDADRTMPQVLYGKRVTEFSRRFPLENIEELDQFEKDINEENKESIVRYIIQLLQKINIIQSLLSPQGLLKNIVNVLSESIIMDSNVDGHHNKNRLLNYPKMIDVLFHACNKDDYTSKMFLDDLRRALKMVKNRCHKNSCRARQKLREEHAEQNCNIVKTEEIYFD